jgi:hypothetical protein
MKKVQLIEIGILAVALICGYKFFDSLVNTAITTLFYRAALGYGDSLAFIFQYLILAALYFGLFLLLVRKRTWIAGYIDKQGEPGPDPAESDKINISLSQNNLLFIVLISLCLITLVTEIPSILIGIYNYFKKEVSWVKDPALREDIDFKVAAIKLVVTVILLYYARQISDWFTKSADQIKVVAEIPNES